MTGYHIRGYHCNTIVLLHFLNGLSFAIWREWLSRVIASPTCDFLRNYRSKVILKWRIMATSIAVSVYQIHIPRDKNK